MIEPTNDTPEAGDANRDGVHTLSLAIAVVLLVAGWRLVLIGTTPALSGGILMLAAGLAAAGVAIGWHAPPARADRLDLATRIGLGLLGGVLAGLVHGMLTESAGWSGLAQFVGASIDTELGAQEWLGRAAAGGAWGLAFGALYPLVPGQAASARGTWAGLLVALWQLLYVYPVRDGLGIGGLEAGIGVPFLVIIGLGVSGIVAARTIAWAGRVDERLSAPLVETP